VHLRLPDFVIVPLYSYHKGR